MNDRRTDQWLADSRGVLSYWQSWLRFETALTPMRIALAYLTFGMAALFLSDVVFVQYLSDPLLGLVQALKGAIEVLLTAGLILFLTGRREAQLQRHIGHLDRQHEQLQVLHRVLRHNLRNDLNVIHGYTRWIQAQSEEEQFDSACAKILRTVDDMTRYTEQASRIKRITEGETLVRTYDLTELLPRMLDDHPEVTSDVELSVSLPESARVTANHMFESALEEVVTNAVKHNDAEHPRIAIEVRAVDDPNRAIEISVSDNGPGIPDEEIEPLREGKERPVVHLSGLGLWFVAWTVRHSGGTLGFETNDWGGTTVRIRVSESTADLDTVLPDFVSWRNGIGGNAVPVDSQTERF